MQENSAKSRQIVNTFIVCSYLYLRLFCLHFTISPHNKTQDEQDIEQGRHDQ